MYGRGFGVFYLAPDGTVRKESDFENPGQL